MILIYSIILPVLQRSKYVEKSTKNRSYKGGSSKAKNPYLTSRLSNFLYVCYRLLTTLCKNIPVKSMSRERCQGFGVFPPSAFYPIPWRQWSKYFSDIRRNEVLNSLNNTIAIHVWNKHSVKQVIKIGSKVPYEQLAAKYCPRVYAASDTYF